ncbi:MAG TPA: hypothetical protein VK204_14505 [Nocardioidaceae bacterium]|nr:hypothetical protein [Nocardioidaceae bacterium]
MSEKALLVHWSGEGSPRPEEPVTDDKTKVTCPGCLRVIDFIESARRGD